VDSAVAEVGSDVVFSYSGTPDTGGATILAANALTEGVVFPDSGTGVATIGFGFGLSDRLAGVASIPIVESHEVVESGSMPTDGPHPLAEPNHRIMEIGGRKA